MKKKWTLFVVTIVLAMAIFIVGGLVYFRYFFSLSGPCAEDRITEIQSPEANYIAREFRSNCGATSDWATDFDIKSLTTGEWERVLSLKGDLIDSCSVIWLDTSSLRIKCDRVGEIYNSRDEFHNIKVFLEIKGR